jgi:hypothetical protein
MPKISLHLIGGVFSASVVINTGNTNPKVLYNIKEGVLALLPECVHDELRITPLGNKQCEFSFEVPNPYSHIDAMSKMTALWGVLGKHFDGIIIDATMPVCDETAEELPM